MMMSSLIPERNEYDYEEEEGVSSSSNNDDDEGGQGGGGNGIQYFPNGTKISLWLGVGEVDRQRYDGIILGYNLFNLPTNDEGQYNQYIDPDFYSSFQDPHDAIHNINEEWRYMVQLPSNNNTSTISDSTSTSTSTFIELVREEVIHELLSKNCAEYLIDQHFNPSIRDEIITCLHDGVRHPNIDALTDTIDWKSLLDDIIRSSSSDDINNSRRAAPDMATYDLYQNSDRNGCMNILFLIMIIPDTVPPYKEAVIRKLVELNPNAINNHIGTGSEYIGGTGSGFFGDFKTINPSGLRDFDPKILRLLMRKTPWMGEIHYLEDNGLGHILMFFLRQQQQQQQQQQELLSKTKSTKISIYVKVILEESSDAVVTLLGRVFESGGLLLHSNYWTYSAKVDVGLKESFEISDETFQFALECASKNKYNCFLILLVTGPTYLLGLLSTYLLLSITTTAVMKKA